MDDLVEHLRDLLGAGPRPCSELVRDLLDQGRFDDLLDDLDEGDAGLVELELRVQDEAELDGGIWVSAHVDPVLAVTSHLAGDIVLTHRLTAEELEDGAVRVVPDLVVLDWDARDRLQLGEDGGSLVHAHRPDLPGDDDTWVFEGPTGWLAAFSPGDLLAFRRAGPTVDVTLVPADAPPSDDRDDEVDREVALLRDVATRRLGPGDHIEVAPVVLDALAADAPTDGAGAFRSPGRPLGELLEAAGLERKGSVVGFREGEWPGTAETAWFVRRMELSRKFEFGPCCDRAFDEVTDFVRAQMDQQEVDLLGSPAGDRFDVDDLTEALAHGWVAAAVAVSELHFAGQEGADGERDAGPALAKLGTAIVERAAAGHRAAGRLLLALEAEHRGDAVAAESQLRQALTEEPDYVPPARLLAEMEIDRSNFGEAVSLMERSGAASSLQHRYVARLQSQLHRPYRNVGRNQPCPCGSGRKHKVCCLDDPKILPEVRGAAVGLKLLLFAHSTRAKDRLEEVAASAVDSDHPDRAEALDEMANDPLMPDLLAFEGGCGPEYLAQRGQLLPEDERELLDAAVKEPRRLWEVVSVRSDGTLRVHDPETGRTADVRDPEVSRSKREPAGKMSLWRIVRVGDHDCPLGPRIEVEPEQREPLRQLLATDPDAHDLARWYGNRS